MVEKDVTKTKNKKFKIAYAFTVVIALCALLFSKIATEKSLGNIESLEKELTTQATTQFIINKEEETVRQNLSDVPDTREQKNNQNDSTTNNLYNKPYNDYYCLPFGSEIIKDFSTSPVYSKTMKDWRTHNGIDFSGEEGGAVVAISYGEIISIYDDTLLGTCVLIDHGNGVTAKYCGLNKDTLTIKENSTVNIETVIGHLGEIPGEKTEGAHLHFEITHNGEIVEPLELMGK